MTSADEPIGRPRRPGASVLGRKALGYAVLMLLAAIALIPFLWTLSTSLKSIDEVFVYPPQWLPSTPRWSNYSNLWHQLPMGRWIWNSSYIAVCAVVGKLILSSTAAFAFARLRFPGRDLIFYIFLGALMIPWEVTLIPGFVLMRQLGWIDTHLAIIIPSLGDVFGIFLLRQAFMSIPSELEDAARMDGASHFMVYRRVVLPLSRPALAVVAVLGFMNVWNSFLWPLIMLNSTDKYTLPVGLQLLNSEHSTQWTFLMAGDMIALVPILVVYIAAQRYFVQGITLTGLKG
jgi:multiple sugar transport system permease protein